MEGHHVLRVARTAGFGAVATVLALGGHVLGGGAPPPFLVAVLAVLPAAVAGAHLSRRAPSVLRAGLVLGAVQLGSHTLFGAATPAAATASCGGGAHAGHGTMASAVASCAAMCCGAADAVHGAALQGAALHHGGVPMLLGHGLAVVLTALLLTRGERAVEAAVAALARHVALLLPGPLPAVGPRTASVPAPVADLPAAGRRAVRHVRRRGPPVVVVAVV